MVDRPHVLTLVLNSFVVLDGYPPGVGNLIVEKIRVGNDRQSDSYFLSIRVVLILVGFLIARLHLHQSFILHFTLSLSVITQLFANFLRLARQFLDLGQQNARLPLLQMITELFQNLHHSFFLVGLDLEIDVAVAVLRLTEGDLVVKLGLAQRLLMTGDNFSDEIFRELSCCLPTHSLLSFAILLSLLLELLRVV